MKTKHRHELSAEQQEFVRNVLRDPVLFATHFLGVELWESEVELLRSIQTNRRTAIRACHAVGKNLHFGGRHAVGGGRGIRQGSY